MHAYRCKECTLYRCDGLDETCTECLTVQAAATEDRIREAKATGIKVILSNMVVHFAGNPVPPAPAQATPMLTPSPPPILITLIPGDYKHNAIQVARAIMSVDWATLHRYATANGINFPTKGGIADLHTTLQMYGMSP